MKRPGYTLVELMIAVIVIAILAVVVVMGATKAQAKSKLSKTSTDLVNIATSLTQFAEDNNYLYPPDVNRSVPPGLERYLTGGAWPTSAWPNGVFDWDNWIHPTNGQQIYQISYRLCDVSDPIETCGDPVLFPNFVRNSSIFYCVSGPCIPHNATPTVPGYCVNCTPKEQNYTP